MIFTYKKYRETCVFGVDLYIKLFYKCAFFSFVISGCFLVVGSCTLESYTILITLRFYMKIQMNNNNCVGKYREEEMYKSVASRLAWVRRAAIQTICMKV